MAKGDQQDGVAGANIPASLGVLQAAFQLLEVTCRFLFSALYSKPHPTPVLGVPAGWGPPC